MMMGMNLKCSIASSNWPESENLAAIECPRCPLWMSQRPFHTTKRTGGLLIGFQFWLFSRLPERFVFEIIVWLLSCFTGFHHPSPDHCCCPGTLGELRPHHCRREEPEQSPRAWPAQGVVMLLIYGCLIWYKCNLYIISFSGWYSSVFDVAHTPFTSSYASVPFRYFQIPKNAQRLWRKNLKMPRLTTTILEHGTWWLIQFVFPLQTKRKNMYIRTTIYTCKFVYI